LSFSCRYIAIHVPDLEAAEDFYRGVFGMDLLFRESEGDGSWYTLRDGLDWAETKRQGISISMVALQRDEFVLALFEGSPHAGTVYEICVALDAPEVEAIEARLPTNAVVEESASAWVRFLDPFGFRWAVRDADGSFRSSGEIADRWIG